MSSLAAPHSLHVLDDSGDTQTLWRPKDTKSVKAAEKAFAKAKDLGYWAVKSDADGQNRELIHQFDPNAESIGMSRQFQGG